jgi:O-antigen/teichoic acid export membrane protein
MISASLSDQKLAIRNWCWSFLGVCSRLFGNSLVFLLIARLPSVGTAGFGTLTYAATFASLVVILAQFGLPTLIVRKCAAAESSIQEHFIGVFALRCFLSAVCVISALAYLLGTVPDQESFHVCIVMLFAMFIGAFSVDLQSIFQARERMDLELLGTFSENAILLLAISWAFLVNCDTLTVAFIFLISKSLAFSLNLSILQKKWPIKLAKLDLHQCYSLLREALPFALTSILAASVVCVDTLLLQSLSTSPNPFEDVSSYQAAMRLLMVPMLLPELLGKVLLPQFSRRFDKTSTSRTFSKSLEGLNHFLLSLGILVGMILFVRGDDIIRLVYGGRLNAAEELLPLLGVTLMMRFGAVYNLYFTVRGQMWFRVLSGFVALAALISFNLVFIPWYGARGAAYASICSHVVYWIPILIAVRLQEGRAFLGWRWSSTCAAALVLVAVLLATESLPILLSLPIYAILCMTAAIVTLPEVDRKTLLLKWWT